MWRIDWIMVSSGPSPLAAVMRSSTEVNQLVLSNTMVRAPALNRASKLESESCAVSKSSDTVTVPEVTGLPSLTV